MSNAALAGRTSFAALVNLLPGSLQDSCNPYLSTDSHVAIDLGTTAVGISSDCANSSTAERKSRSVASSRRNFPNSV
eukprot:scaffold126986_cov35-Tisochrysis_lutea.AAC.1